MKGPPSLAATSWYLALLFAAWTLVMSLVTVVPRSQANWNLMTMGFALASAFFVIAGVASRRFLCSSRYYRLGWPALSYYVLAVLLTGIFVFGFLG